MGITTLCSHLGANVSEAEIRNAIDFLSSEGHLYSTIDEDHFKATSVECVIRPYMVLSQRCISLVAIKV